jgi:hypothetical protein
MYRHLPLTVMAMIGPVVAQVKREPAMRAMQERSRRGLILTRRKLTPREQR